MQTDLSRIRREELEKEFESIRLWQPAHPLKVGPNPTAAKLLSEILENNTGIGTMDLVWGPEIELKPFVEPMRIA